MAQKTRLSRALSKAEALPDDTEGSNAKHKALLAVHEDGASTYREYAALATGDDEWVRAERLKHLNAVYELAPTGKAMQGLLEEYVLALLDEGEAGQVRKVLEGLGAGAKEKAVFAWSLALVELVAWKGEEEGASEAVCIAAVEAALRTNVYVGIFLSNLDCYTREIDPTHSPPIQGRVKGSVEEALAYTGVAAGCWIEFDEDGCVSMLVGGCLEAIDVVWPPTSEGKTNKFVKQFVDATEIAEKEAAEDSGEEEDGGEDGEEDEEEGEEAAAGEGGGKKAKR